MQRLDHVVVEHPGPARGDGTHRQLLVAWHAQLADDEDIERRLQRLGNFEGHRHAAARQGQHQHVRAAGVRDQLLGEFRPASARSRNGVNMMSSLSHWCAAIGALGVGASWKRSPSDSPA